jgi:hypothetical protein
LAVLTINEFFHNYFLLFLTVGTLISVLKDDMSLRSHKIVEIMVYLKFFTVPLTELSANQSRAALLNLLRKGLGRSKPETLPLQQTQLAHYVEIQLYPSSLNCLL